MDLISVENGLTERRARQRPAVAKSNTSRSANKTLPYPAGQLARILLFERRYTYRIR